MHKTRTFPCMNTPLKCYIATHHATVLTVCMGASWPFPSNCIECFWWQPLYFGNYNFFNFFLLLKMNQQMSQTVPCIFYKKKLKNNKIKQNPEHRNPPGAHTHTKLVLEEWNQNWNTTHAQGEWSQRSSQPVYLKGTFLCSQCPFASGQSESSFYETGLSHWLAAFSWLL